MPIANQIAELTNYLVVILGAIVLEKTLLSALGYVTYTYIIPFACAVGIISLLTKKDIFTIFALKIALFGIVLSAAIPVGMNVSDVIYSSYQVSIEQTVEIAEQNNDYIEEKRQDFSEEDKNWIENIGDYLSNLTSKIGTGIADIVEKGQDTLSSLIDAISVLIITTCVIPVGVVLIFVWITKLLFGIDLKEIFGHKDRNIKQNMQEHITFDKNKKDIE